MDSNAISTENHQEVYVKRHSFWKTGQLDINFELFLKDLSVLNEIIDSVTPNQSSLNIQNREVADGDDEDENKLKRAFVAGATKVSLR